MYEYVAYTVGARTGITYAYRTDTRYMYRYSSVRVLGAPTRTRMHARRILIQYYWLVVAHDIINPPHLRQARSERSTLAA